MLKKVVILVAALFIALVSYPYYIYNTTQPYNFVLKADIPPKDIVVFNANALQYKRFEPYEGEDKYMFSIIIPVHNVEPYLEECLDSILGQSYTDYEVIMVENNSTDRSLKIAESYAKAYPNFKLIVQDGGRAGGARNTGIKAASGQYILYLDSDDYLAEGVLQDGVNTILLNQPDIIVYDYVRVDSKTKERISYRGQKLSYNVMHSTSDISPVEAIQKMSVVVWGRIYKRNKLLENEILFRNNMNHEDVLYSLVLFSYDDLKFILRDMPIVYYRLGREGSIMNSQIHIDDTIAIARAYQEFLEGRDAWEEHKFVILGQSFAWMKDRMRSLPIGESLSVLKMLEREYNSPEHHAAYGDVRDALMQYKQGYLMVKNGYGFWYWYYKIYTIHLRMQIAMWLKSL